MNERKQPAIRFKGFSDEWEQHELGECFGERIESFPDGELLSVTINGGVKRFCELGRNDNSNDDKSKYKKVCIGDIAYNSMRMWQGASGYSLYEGIVSPAYTVLYPNPGVNSRCIAYQLKLPAIIRTFQINSQGITSDNWNLKYPSLSKIAICISADEREQGLIAQFFSHVDTLITMHRRKYEKLQALKASMLEKMFPKDGADVPEIRFKGFTGAWDRREIGECFTERNESLPDGELLSVTINNGVRKFSELDRRDTSNSDKSKYKRVCVGDIAYNSMRMWQGASGYSSYEGIVSPAYTVLSPNPGIISEFIACYFKSTEMIHTFQINSQGITSDNWNLKFPTLGTIEIYVPRDVEEQKKIAAYFASFEILIQQSQQELDKLQSIKKALLEKMFV